MSVFKKDHFSPKGLLMWSYVFTPDSGGKYSDDKYKVKLRLYGDEAQKMIEMIESFIPEAAEYLEKAEGDIKGMPYAQAVDKDGKDIAGAFDFTLKTKNAPLVIDAKKRTVTKKMLPDFKDGRILGEGVVAFKPHAWTVKRESGLGLYLQAVQIIERQGGVDMSKFGEYDDGFTADDSVSSFDDGDGEEDDTPDFATK